jgi:hypothetical protein
MVSRNLKVKVKNNAEFEAIKRAMEMQDVRAFVLIVGLLDPFSQRARQRIINFAVDTVDEQSRLGNA